MGANPDMNPVNVHIHINRNNLGFEVRYNQISFLMLSILVINQ